MRLTFLILLAGLCLVVAACGDDDDDASGIDADADTDTDTNTDTDTDTSTDVDTDTDADSDDDDDEFYDNELGGLAVLSDGSAVINGSFYFPVIFGDDEDAEVLCDESTYQNCVGRFDADGELLWAREVESSLGDSGWGFDVEALPDDTVVISQGNPLVAGYDENGNHLWEAYGEYVPEVGVPGPMVTAISSSQDGAFWITGRHNSEIEVGDTCLVDIDGGSGGGSETCGDGDTINLQHCGSQAIEEIFTVKYSADGSIEWAVSEAGEAFSMAVAPLEDGSVVIAGLFPFEVTFAEGQSNSVTLVKEEEDSGHELGFLARYDSQGTFLWAVKTAGYSQIYRFVTFSDNSFVVTCMDSSTMSRYSADGDLIWSSEGLPLNYNALDIVGLDDESFLLVGYFVGDASFETTNGTATLIADGGGGIALIKYNVDNTIAWARKIVDGGAAPGRIALADDGSILLAGLCGGTSIFGDEPNQVTLTADPGGSNIFLAKFDSDSELIWARLAVRPH